jgi:enoyl-CoA hydratase/carnithine racemase
MSDELEARASLNINGVIATITLTRPAAYNAIDIDMALRLKHLALEVEAREDIRVLVICGAGKSFCAGGDLDFFVRHVDDLAPPITELLSDLNAFLLVLHRMPKLVLTSVQGVAAGAGFSLAFMGDFCVAADNARLRPAYIQIGLSPDAGGTAGVVRAVGPRRAMQLFLGEQEIDAQQAMQWGMVAKVVPALELEQQTHAFALHLAQWEPTAAVATKRLIGQSANTGLQAQLGEELKAVVDCMNVETFRSRLQHLRQKRKG